VRNRKTEYNIVKLKLDANNLAGPLKGFDRMVYLTDIVLANNSLTGHIPDPSAMKELANLLVGDNKFGGSVPSEIVEMTNLEGLQLSGNNLTGRVPDLSPLKKLEALGLGRNHFSGKIPNLLYYKYKVCDLAGNKFECPLQQFAVKFCGMEQEPCTDTSGASPESMREKLLDSVTIGTADAKADAEEVKEEEWSAVRHVSTGYCWSVPSTVGTDGKSMTLTR
jgi:hypothetical protein